MKTSGFVPNLVMDKLGLKDFIGESPALLAVIQRIPAIADCASNVLIAGETGTGKEVCARAIHDFGPRSKEPFVPVNCGAVPRELIENELFGHAPGAYTGSAGSALGLIRDADGGTLFLDEIDSLPLSAQVKLLRFLQDKEFRPLGSSKMCKANVRVIAAANCDLPDAVRSGRFRKDLYYRLNVIAITMPPLRQRPGDVPLLARHFIAKLTTAAGKEPKSVTADALAKLLFHRWPGNVRELEHVIERSVVMSGRAMIDASEIELPQSAMGTGDDTFKARKAIAIADFEREYLQQLLQSARGNISRASRLAGMHRKSLQRLIRKRQQEPRVEGE